MADLYAILGVPRDATASLIKSAYRTLVKSHHPDVGGDPEAFRAIQRAYEVLSDPERRKFYDETGATDDTPEENADAPAIATLNRLLETLLSRQELWTGDLLVELRRSLQNGRVDTQNKIADLQQQMNAIENVKKRLKRKPDTNPTFSTLLDLQLRGMEESMTGGRAHEAMLTRAFDLLDGYSMDPDPAHGVFTQATLRGMTNSTNERNQRTDIFGQRFR